MKIERFPLCWPAGKPRTVVRLPSPFRRPVKWTSRRHSMVESVNMVEDNVRIMGGRSLVVSTNVKLRVNGLPYCGQAQPLDTGAAVYFTLDGRQIVFACDKFDRAECNLYSIGKTIEATRAIERWGSATMEQSFRGFTAIPERAGGSAWWETLGVPINATREQAVEAYRVLVKKHHPDRGGAPDLFRRVQEAWEQCEAISQ